MLIDTRFVSKPWGYEEWIDNNHLYCGKILFVKRNKYCSWHFHEQKTETFHVLSGRVRLAYSPYDIVEEDGIMQFQYNTDILVSLSQTLVPGDSFHIPVGMVHRFYGLEDSKIIEISTHHEDSDSIRLLPSCD